MLWTKFLASSTTVVGGGGGGRGDYERRNEVQKFCNFLILLNRG